LADASRPGWRARVPTDNVIMAFLRECAKTADEHRRAIDERIAELQSEGYRITTGGWEDYEYLGNYCGEDLYETIYHPVLCYVTGEKIAEGWESDDSWWDIEAVWDGVDTTYNTPPLPGMSENLAHFLEEAFWENAEEIRNMLGGGVNARPQ
jgi:hypothetical protein